MLTEADLKHSHELLTEVIQLADTSKQKHRSKERLVKKTLFVLPATEKNKEPLNICSFKFNEFLYKADPCPFPTLARGLFAYVKDDVNHVAVRGYDKFFNIGEVPTTKWEWIRENTTGPYEVTAKENGCIIFIAAHPDRGLIVTSKHSVGGGVKEVKEVKVQNPEILGGHADVGRKWLEKHLKDAGKTEEDFAEFLKSIDSTAVFELCDDDFEEHVLAYTGGDRGLYLHGLNTNAIKFVSAPSREVRAAAKTFGFKETSYFLKDSADEVKQYTDFIKESGGLEGRVIEGFVVRCIEKADGKQHFFKIKYDEPYLMYREWREATFRILSGNPARSTYELTASYIPWVKEKIKQYPERFENYKKHKGIIDVRNWFLKEKKEGRVRVPNPKQISSPQNFRKILIIPVATIGCGKTTISLVLSDLFKVGHVQNDNITAKKSGAHFQKAVIDAFSKKEIVIADRNNHMSFHRDNIISAVRAKYKQCRVICFYWNISLENRRDVLELTARRVEERGENHQSLTPGRNSEFKTVLHDFINGFQPLDSNSAGDGLINETVQFSVHATLRQSVRVAVDALVALCGLKAPTDAAIEKAVGDATRNYRPTVIKQIKNQKKRKPAYFGIAVDSVDVRNLVERLLKPVDRQKWDFFAPKLPTAHHITLLHSTQKPNNEDLWTTYTERSESGKNTTSSAEASSSCTFKIRRLVCTDRVLVLEVYPQSLDPAWIRCSSNHPHITVAVAPGIKAFEGHETLRALREAEENMVPVKFPCRVLNVGGSDDGAVLKGTFRDFY